MFTGKMLPKMALHGLTSGEHCVDLEKIERMSNLLKNRYISENQHNVHEKCGSNGIFSIDSIIVVALLF